MQIHIFNSKLVVSLDHIACQMLGCVLKHVQIYYDITSTSAQLESSLVLESAVTPNTVTVQLQVCLTVKEMMANLQRAIVVGLAHFLESRIFVILLFCTFHVALLFLLCQRYVIVFSKMSSLITSTLFYCTVYYIVHKQKCTNFYVRLVQCFVLFYCFQIKAF